LFLFIGNRTPKQVSSRVQKYFIKLLKAGLPIPGRGPKLKLDVKKGLSSHRHQRNNNFLFKRSTFFPHQDISCNASEENKEQPIVKKFVSIKHYYFCKEIASENLANFQEDDATSGGSDDNPELRHINLLRQVKAEKEQDLSSMYEHIGYKVYI
jgi:hypothetical protein